PSPERDVDGAADLLVEQDLVRPAVDAVVQADAELADAARAFVEVEHLVQVALVLVARRADDPSLLEAKANAGDAAPGVDARRLEVDVALDRALDGRGVDL